MRLVKLKCAYECQLTKHGGMPVKNLNWLRFGFPALILPNAMHEKSELLLLQKRPIQ